MPNDCVGLIIGKGGETIRLLQNESGARIQVAKKESGQGMRNVYVEGSADKFEKAKQLIEDIIKDNKKSNDSLMHIGESNPFEGPHYKMPVPQKHVGQVIGKNGDTLRSICSISQAYIYIPKEPEIPGGERVIEISGGSQAIEKAR